MGPLTRLSLKKKNPNLSISTKVLKGSNTNRLIKAKNQKNISANKSKTPSLRTQLNGLTVPVLKNILRLNNQNPFGNKSNIISRILYMITHGAYPECPKCFNGRLKVRQHRRKNQSKYCCGGFPMSFRSPASFHRCDYVTDECNKKIFVFSPEFEFLNK